MKEDWVVSELLTDPRAADRERLRRDLEAEAEEKRAAQAEVEAERAQLVALEEVLELQKKSLKTAEAELFSVEMRHEANKFRRIDQRLKGEIEWYVPLEDILGVPIIGVDMAEFIASVEGREDIVIKEKDMTMSLSRRNEKTDRRRPDFFVFEIRPEHVRCYDDDGPEPRGAQVIVLILPDCTLRPHFVRNYDRLFSRDGSNDSASGTDIQPPGSCGFEDVPPFSRHADWRFPHWGLRVCRYRDRFGGGERESGVRERYSDRGILIDREEYGPRGSESLPQPA